MDYQVVKLLGQGTYAQVFLGNDLKTGQQVRLINFLFVLISPKFKKKKYLFQI